MQDSIFEIEHVYVLSKEMKDLWIGLERYNPSVGELVFEVNYAQTNVSPTIDNERPWCITSEAIDLLHHNFLVSEFIPETMIKLEALAGENGGCSRLRGQQCEP
jgi:hypothetical protein